MKLGDISKNIYLAGFMATGKTTAGKILAKKLGRRFVDTDEEIVRKKRKSIAKIFKTEGEKIFRALEREEVARAARMKGAVVSLGGGALIDERNRKKIYRTGILIHLTATPRAIIRRIRNDKTLRPILRKAPPRYFKRQVEFLLEIRQPFYEGAQIVADTTGVSPSAVTDKILGKLKKIL